MVYNTQNYWLFGLHPSFGPSVYRTTDKVQKLSNYENTCSNGIKSLNS
jgi:hypothetical protein